MEGMRSFNTAGPINPQDHYNIPPLDRMDLDYVLRLIADKKYFSLHAPRQTGKTSALLALQDRLNSGSEGPYRCVYVNVEPGQAFHEEVGAAMEAIIGSLAGHASEALGDDFVATEGFDILERFGAGSGLLELLCRWTQSDPRPLVLLIDEIDSLEGDTLLSVLRQLRSGHNLRPRAFARSIVLCGVRNLHACRIHSRSKGESVTGGSVFNISADSLRLRDFSHSEVKTLLTQHTAETGQVFRPEALERVWSQTQGQPWLVNALCERACFRYERGRDRERPIEENDILEAQEQLILARVVHLDQLAHKLQEDRVRRVIEPLLSGADARDLVPEKLAYVRDIGLVAPDDPLRMANPIYQEVVPRELTWGTQATLTLQTAAYVDASGALRLTQLLEDFQDFFRQHSEHWKEWHGYKEAGPQLLLQAFLQKIVTGSGRIEREYGLGRGRTDLLIVWPREPQDQRFIVECKVLHRSLESTVDEGVRQAAGYMDRCGAEEGHLVIFDRSKRRWEDKLFRRREVVGSIPIEVWGM